MGEESKRKFGGTNMIIGIRPSTLKRLREKQMSKVSPLHTSIARLSYLKEQRQQPEEQQLKKDMFYRIIRRNGLTGVPVLPNGSK